MCVTAIHVAVLLVILVHIESITTMLDVTDIGIGVIVVAYLEMMCWHTAAYNQCERIRSQLFKAILRQEIGWFDTHEIGELNTRLVE